VHEIGDLTVSPTDSAVHYAVNDQQKNGVSSRNSEGNDDKFADFNDNAENVDEEECSATQDSNCNADANDNSPQGDVGFSFIFPNDAAIFRNDFSFFLMMRGAYYSLKHEAILSSPDGSSIFTNLLSLLNFWV
jgi:hypothetical protein